MSRKSASSDRPQQPTEAKETRFLVEHGFDLARSLNIQWVLVIAPLIVDRRLIEKHRENERVLWVSHDEISDVKTRRGDRTIRIPNNPVNNLDQVKLALMTAIFQEVLKEDETVLCLVNMVGSRKLDNLLIMNPERDFRWFAEHKLTGDGLLADTQSFIRLIDIAVQFAREGREGKPIGAIFLLGEEEEIETICRPLILNPCQGHPKKKRNIHDAEFLETLRELSALDGAFVVALNGVVERAGVYIQASASKKVNLPAGLGARHFAAASATAKVPCIALVISESSGAVTVFSEGADIMSIKKWD